MLVCSTNLVLRDVKDNKLEITSGSSGGYIIYSYSKIYPELNFRVTLILAVLKMVLTSPFH